MLALWLGVALAADGPVPETARVVSVYDGDTFTLDTGDKVRLKWVNAPEMKPAEPYAVDAREAARRFIEGRTVQLVGAGERDGYGRILAGVRTEEGDLSLHLVELGLGHVFVIPPDDLDLAPLLAAQAAARAAGRGIWSTDRYQGALHITSFHANAPGPDDQNVNGEYVRVANITTEPVNLSGYRVRDLEGREFELPAVTVPAGHTVQLVSGRGDDQVDPARQLEVHLGSEIPVWNNSRDTCTILDKWGVVVDARVHETDNPKD